MTTGAIVTHSLCGQVMASVSPRLLLVAVFLLLARCWSPFGFIVEEIESLGFQRVGLRCNRLLALVGDESLGSERRSRLVPSAASSRGANGENDLAREVEFWEGWAAVQSNVRLTFLPRG